MDLVIIILFCIGAAFVQRVSGFGFGIFIMTVLPFLLPSYGEATTLSGALAAVMSLIVLVKMWKFVPWRRLWPILITFLVTSAFAVNFVSLVQDSVLRRILGMVFIALSIYFFFFSERITIKPTVTMQVTMGFLSGVLGGLFAMQGPPAVLYFIASERDKNNYMAITQAYFAIGNIFMTIVRAQNGFLTPTVQRCWFYAVATLFIGIWLGRLVFDKVSAPILRKIVYVYMAISGILALVL